MRLRVFKGDITDSKAAGIIISAGTTLLGGGAVAAAVHRKGGISLTAACRSLQGCRQGEAKITYGYKLPARYVIHAVGPFWRGGTENEAALLVSACEAALRLARENTLLHLAVSLISVEDKRFPLQKAVALLAPAVLRGGAFAEQIDFVCADAAACAAVVRQLTLLLLQAWHRGRTTAETVAALALLLTAEPLPEPSRFAANMKAINPVIRAASREAEDWNFMTLNVLADSILQVYEESN
ncbi:macro domain-containing protein [Megasphaera vaginalis (ex Srinivasan et al. 2021)]|uniref:Macro domain protein n=1 Tax=Megasphaera vaginalis (ex Srinivasan et al. 2021) TaxID=1111454 RepID=U7USQ2_9FIRM|nr:macro domain-containing protein [Megasphaera vaginalis (ex Srinivasan et al. 2021)]ERT62472.1 macro domain protein [Megasphaera vaginalis (ex Srinivasan et al. 2021)]